jgi:hypothetical protein
VIRPVKIRDLWYGDAFIYKNKVCRFVRRGDHKRMGFDLVSKKLISIDENEIVDYLGQNLTIFNHPQVPLSSIGEQDHFYIEDECYLIDASKDNVVYGKEIGCVNMLTGDHKRFSLDTKVDLLWRGSFLRKLPQAILTGRYE